LFFPYNKKRGFGDGFVILRDAFKHVLSFRHHFLSSENSFGAVLYEKGENIKQGIFWK
jgi:hypothetical protein